MSRLKGYRLTLLIKACYQLIKWDFMLRFRPYAHWKAALHTSPQHTPPLHISTLKIDNKTDLPTAHTVARHVACVVRKSPLPFNCMRRTLALKSLLAQQGIYPTVHIGVKFNVQKQLTAHAWLSFAGECLNDTADNVAQYSEITDNTQQLVQTLAKQ